jgi:hypothetical protein
LFAKGAAVIGKAVRTEFIFTSPNFSAAVPRNRQTPSSSTAADSSFVMRCTYPISHHHGQEPQENGVSSDIEYPD